VTDLLEAAQTVWVVVHPVDIPGLPRHVKLVREDEPHRAVTVAYPPCSTGAFIAGWSRWRSAPRNTRKGRVAPPRPLRGPAAAISCG
jgi:hypothetical protein